MQKTDSCLNTQDTSLTLNQAKEKCFATIDKALSIEKVAIRSALNRVLASDIIAPINVPAYMNSAMDGYALRQQDISDATSFGVISTLYAGQICNEKITKNTCIRIMTGGNDTAEC